MHDQRIGEIFVLSRDNGTRWRILNHRYAPSDQRHLVARLWETLDNEVEVDWIQPTPLPTSYRTALDALDDVTRWTRQASMATRPIFIPYLPPRHAQLD